jgi:predicted MFS family arabinose efflux permease
MSAPTLSRTMVLLLALVCGVTTANAYYAQPLLELIARTLHSSATAASNLITAGQTGTAIGLLFLVPAADIVRRRPLLLLLFALDTVALAAMAVVPNVAALTGLSMLVGLAAVANPIILAYAASLADDRQRGKVLGTIMSGILVGILLSRVAASFIAEAGGWRTVYVVAAAAMALMTGAVALTLPNEPAGLAASYRSQLAAVLTQFRVPTMRSRCLIGACVMATFTGFWTTVAFLLSRSPFSFGQVGIGLFALSGVAGALTTSFGGTLIDRYRERRLQLTGIALAALAVSFMILAAGGSSLWVLIMGAVVMDAAMQAIHVTNQSVVYELDSQARSRLASGYMTSFAIGGAAGSVTFGIAYASAGWIGTCLAGLAFALIATVVWRFASSTERAAQNRAPVQPATSRIARS